MALVADLNFPSDALLAGIVRSSSDAILTEDLEGIVTFWNHGAEQLFGYSVREMIGSPVALLFPPERVAEEEDILIRIRAGERLGPYDTSCRHKSGSRLDISLGVSPFYDAHGNVIGAARIARARSGAHRNQPRVRDPKLKLRDRSTGLEEKISELDAFSHSLAHDLRSPLQAIRNLAEILLAGHADLNAAVRGRLQKIIEATDRMGHSIQDVLGSVRGGRVPLEPVDVDRLMRDIIRNSPGLQPPRAIVDLQPLPRVKGDVAALTRCLSNLLQSALKSVSPEVTPRLDVFAKPADGSVRICIRDNGGKLDAERREQLRALFAPSIDANYEGIGLALMIARKAAEQMKGSLGLELDPGVGNTFWLELAPAP